MKINKYLLIIIALLVTHFSFSKEIIVTSTADSGTGTFREAVNIAQPNDTIIINVKGTITLDNTILFNQKSNLTIIGPYPKHNTFTANGSFNMFDIYQASNISFKGLGFLDCAAPSVISIKFSSNITFKDCLIENNNCTHSPLNIQSSGVDFFNSTFANNLGNFAGAAALTGDISNGIPTFYNCTFYSNYTSNTANGGGGGAIRSNIPQVNLYNNLFKGNYCYIASGARTALFGQSSTFNCANNIFVDNYEDGNQGTGQQVTGLINDLGGNRIVLNSSESSPFTHVNSIPVSANSLYLTPNLIEDGYGLKYFRITNINSSLVNKGELVVIPGGKDCRRAPRINPSTLPNQIIDVGPVEYTPYIVTNANATGLGSLANAVQYGGFVEFDIPNFDPTNAISLTNILNVGQSVYIDGYSQPGSAIPGPGTDGFNGVTPADSLIQITNGNSLGIGINVTAPNVTIAGLEIYGFNNYGVTNTQNNFNLYGCHIGFYKSGGSFFIDGCGNSGVLVNNSDNIQIGGNEHWQRNVISANGNLGGTTSNIKIGASTQNIKIIGNFIGLHPTGNSAFSPNTNAQGILFDGNSSTTQITIGGSSFLSRNIISGNSGEGIEFINSSNALVLNNIIGLAADTNTILGNAQNGINIVQGTSITISDNIISGNQKSGVYTYSSSAGVSIFKNIIGTTPDGLTAKPNGENGIYVGDNSSTNIYDNLISGNTKNGIYAEFGGTDLNIYGNFIGIDTSGTIAIPNQENGIYITDMHEANIGGVFTNNEENVISGNTLNGIFVESPNVVIDGNNIGLTKDQTAALGNLQNGIYIDTSNVIIGGSNGNVISANGSNGIYCDTGAGNVSIDSCFIGTNSSQVDDFGNSGHGIYCESSSSHNIGVNSPNIIVDNTTGIYLLDSSNDTIQNNFIGVTLNGVNIPNDNGIELTDASTNNIIGPNNIISGNETGVKILGTGTSDNQIKNNYIGVDNTGNTALSNNKGVVIADGASNNIIGGLFSSEKNVISGNTTVGVSIADAGTSNNIVSGNLIGLGINETTSIANGGGIAIFDDADNNHIGGADVDSVNYICSNTNGGINLGTGANNNKIKGNKIGVKPDNSVAGNGGSGIFIEEATNNLIGGTGNNDANEIVNNGASGIEINYSSNNNVILGNIINANTGLAIDINDDGPTDDNSSTTQNGVQMPTILQAFDCDGGPSEVQVGVELRNLINGGDYIIEFYTNANPDPTDYGEASVFVKRFNFTASTTGTDTLSFNLGTTPSNSLSATLTALSSNGGTSEMSANFGVESTPTTPIYTVTDETCNGSGDGSISVQTSAMNYTTIGTTSYFNNATTVSSTQPVGTYNITVTYLNGCQEISTQTLDVGPTPGFTFIASNDTCGLGIGSIVLSDTTTTITGTTQYTIDNGTSFQSNNNFTTLNGGSYNTFMTITIAGNICSSDTQTVTINDINLAANGDMDFTYDNFCAAGTGVVTSNPSYTNGTYTINPTPGGFNTTNGEITGATAGTQYTITYTYGACSTTQTPTASTPVDASFSYDNIMNNTDSLCFGDELAPSTNNSGGTFTIVGFGNPTINNTGVITNAAAGQTYNVEYITSGADCPDTNTVDVFILPLPVQPVISTADTLLCLDDTVQTLTSNIPTNWYINDPTSTALNVSPITSYQPQNIDVPNGTTTFYAYYFDANGCASPYDSINISRVDNSNIQLDDSVAICLGSEVELSAQNTGIVTYFWSNNPDIEDTTDPTIIVSPNEKTYYFVTLTTAEGCIINDSILVTIKNPSECNIETYTAFSPNGDNVNDIWIIDGIEGFKENSVYIYNRWGDLIQKIDNYDNANNVWDGKTKFGTAPTGTYFYIVEANGTKALTGWVQIVK